MSKRKHDEAEGTAANTNTSPAPPLFESTPIHDRSSTFIAIFTPSTTSPRTIQRHPPFESAMHRILAWRKPSSQKSISGSLSTNRATTGSSATAKSSQGSDGGGRSRQSVILETGSDEDGERWAGKKLEQVLVEMDVQGTVVVARWYGGTLLGPIRFQWIQDAAREAVRKWKDSLREDGNGGGGDVGVSEAKRTKIDEGGGDGEDDEKKRVSLMRILRERDSSVTVLRGMLAEKNLELKKREGIEDEEKLGGGGHEQEATAKSPSKAIPDYDSMPLQRLMQLEKARDATLAWILKQIDSIEEKIKAFEEKNDG